MLLLPPQTAVKCFRSQFTELHATNEVLALLVFFRNLDRYVHERILGPPASLFPLHALCRCWDSFMSYRVLRLFSGLRSMGYIKYEGLLHTYICI